MIRCLNSVTADHPSQSEVTDDPVPLVAAPRPSPLFRPQRLICRRCSSRCVQRTATHLTDVAATGAMIVCLARAVSQMQSAGRRRGDDEASARTERTTHLERSNRFCVQTATL
jgi:hypothetical protein